MESDGASCQHLNYEILEDNSIMSGDCLEVIGYEMQQKNILILIIS